ACVTSRVVDGPKLNAIPRTVKHPSDDALLKAGAAVNGMIRGNMTGAYTLDRRTLLLAGLAAAAHGNSAPAQLETLSDWLRADGKSRESGLQSCVERIQAQDVSIHAWVQVLPQKPTGSGSLSGIPFAAKDIIETRGLSTEYGSPVYKGRIGTT